MIRRLAADKLMSGARSSQSAESSAFHQQPSERLSRRAHATADGEDCPVGAEVDGHSDVGAGDQRRAHGAGAPTSVECTTAGRCDGDDDDYCGVGCTDGSWNNDDDRDVMSGRRTHRSASATAGAARTPSGLLLPPTNRRTPAVPAGSTTVAVKIVDVFDLPGRKPVDGTFIGADGADRFQILACDLRAAAVRDGRAGKDGPPTAAGGGGARRRDRCRSGGARRSVGDDVGRDRRDDLLADSRRPAPVFFRGDRRPGRKDGVARDGDGDGQEEGGEIVMSQPFRRASSAVTTPDGEVLGVKDDVGVHFFDAKTKEFIKSVRYGRGRLFGLERFGAHEFVSVDDDNKELVFFDARRMTISATTVRLSARIGELDAASRKPGAGAGNRKSSSLRFLASDNYSRDPRIAVVDLGANCVFVVDPSTGGLINSIGKPGEPGKEKAEFDFPAGAAFLPNGFLIIVDSHNDRLQVFDKGYGFVRFIRVPKRVRHLAGLTVQEIGGKLLALLFHHQPPGCRVMELVLD